MKQYPVNELQIFGDDFETVIGVAQIPTPEATQNFESYLDQDELEFYNKLPIVKQLSISMSTDKFRALLMEMGKL